MSDGLGWEDAYGTTIERIKAQDGDKPRLGIAALMWISHAERPLSADELCHALAVELRSKDFNARNIPSISTLVSCCQGLITVEKETSTVRLVHPTVQDYLSARPDIFSRPHAAMAEICLTYLNSKEVKALPAHSPPVTHDKPFLGYCSIYWGVHAKRGPSDYAKWLALELFREYDSHMSSKLLLENVGHHVRWNFGSDFGSDPSIDCNTSFNGLHCASFFGIVDLVAALIEMGCYDTNERDTRGSTPLAWAVRNGHEEVVKMLLRRREVCPNINDYSGMTPLSHAAWKGHGEMVKMLLEQREVCPDGPDGSGQTPLSYAADGGHEGVVKILLELGEVSPDKPGRYGKTPLAYAARHGDEKIVKLLLERGEVNPDEPDDGGQTPLSLAAAWGREGIVKMLLGREEVSPDKPDVGGRTPLSHAASTSSRGREEVVKMLLSREEVSPDNPDNNGRTPFWYAARNGSEGVAKILLRHGGISSNKPDNYNQTPLMAARNWGYLGMVALLQSHEAETPAQLEA